MTWDYDLVRKILRKVEELPPLEQTKWIEVEGYDPALVVGHVERLIDDEGFLDGRFKRFPSRMVYIVNGITREGREFLEAAQDDSLWVKAKRTILSTSAAISLDLLKSWLRTEAARVLKIPGSY